jgi:hypothetical protein
MAFGQKGDAKAVLRTARARVAEGQPPSTKKKRGRAEGLLALSSPFFIYSSLLIKNKKIGAKKKGECLGRVDP